MSRQAALAQVVRLSIPLCTRFFVGFDTGNSTRQAPSMPNHFSWNLGHLALTMHRVAQMVDSKPLPEADFVTDPGTSGDALRFHPESVAFGSTPADNPARYPPADRARAIFEAAVNRLAASVERATDAELDRPFPWGGGQVPWADLVARMLFHNGVHTGQIIDLRRGLGLKGVLG